MYWLIGRVQGRVLLPVSYGATRSRRGEPRNTRNTRKEAKEIDNSSSVPFRVFRVFRGSPLLSSVAHFAFFMTSRTVGGSLRLTNSLGRSPPGSAQQHLSVSPSNS